MNEETSSPDVAAHRFTSTSSMCWSICSIVTEGWRDLVEKLPVLLQDELAREFGCRRHVGIINVTVLSSETRFLGDSRGEVGVTGQKACVEEVRISVWLRVGKESTSRCYAYQRGLVEYDGNRTGGTRFSLIADAGAEVKGEGGLLVSLGEA